MSSVEEQDISNALLGKSDQIAFVGSAAVHLCVSLICAANINWVFVLLVYLCEVWLFLFCGGYCGLSSVISTTDHVRDLVFKT